MIVHVTDLLNVSVVSCLALHVRCEYQRAGLLTSCKSDWGIFNTWMCILHAARVQVWYCAGTGKTHTVRGILNVWHIVHYNRFLESLVKALARCANLYPDLVNIHCSCQIVCTCKSLYGNP